jgi:predicted PurR-regulated permease PerM
MGKKFGFGSSSRTQSYVQIAFLVVATWYILQFLSILTSVIVPVAISFFLAYFLNPFVSFLERKRISRTIGILILLLIFVIVVTIFVMFVVPLLADQLSDFIAKIPKFTLQIKNWAVPWIESTFNTTLPNVNEATNKIMDRLSQDIMSITKQAYSPLKEVASFAAAGTFFIFSVVTTIFVIPFFTFFLLRDFDKLEDIPQKLIPPRHWEWFDGILSDLDITMSAWLRGQVLVMLILGTLYSIGYSMTGITLSLFIGMLTGFLAFIPYVGAFMGFLLAMLMAILDGGTGGIIGVTVVFVSVQILDAFFITPNVLGKSVGINPAIVVLSLMVFGLLWGFLGALIAVPLAAIINVILKHGLKYYRNSIYYNRMSQ